MSTSPDNPKEHPSTYFVQDRSNLDELTRVTIQDQLITAGMGGVFSEQADPAAFQRVLDVGCGTGGWLISAAKTYGTLSTLAGVDVSGRMIEYARKEAEAGGVSDRVTFYTMDALRMLEFPDDSFDLVNLRFGTSWVRTWEWPKLLEEFHRVCHSGGVVRITDSAFMAQENSPALSRIYDIAHKTLHQAGHLWSLDMAGVTGELAGLLRQYGFQNVETRSHVLEYRAGTEAGHMFYEDVRRGFRTALPFYRKWGQAPEDYEQIYQQALTEMQQPDFVALWPLLTAWGKKPPIDSL